MRNLKLIHLIYYYELTLQAYFKKLCNIKKNNKFSCFFER